jgi:hypothetical protein
MWLFKRKVPAVLSNVTFRCMNCSLNIPAPTRSKERHKLVGDDVRCPHWCCPMCGTESIQTYKLYKEIK